jgi:hypothetical protein
LQYRHVVASTDELNLVLCRRVVREAGNQAQDCRHDQEWQNNEQERGQEQPALAQREYGMAPFKGTLALASALDSMGRQFSIL